MTFITISFEWGRISNDMYLNSKYVTSLGLRPNANSYMYRLVVMKTD